MQIDLTHPGIGYDPRDRTFAAELSSIEDTFSLGHFCHTRAPIRTVNPRTGVEVTFTWLSTDYDQSHEDTYGWWYQAVHNGVRYKFLFIND
jgi:hypothetical protein